MTTVGVSTSDILYDSEVEDNYNCVSITYSVPNETRITEEIKKGLQTIISLSSIVKFKGHSPLSAGAQVSRSVPLSS